MIPGAWLFVSFPPLELGWDLVSHFYPMECSKHGRVSLSRLGQAITFKVKL
jgi:hypothetical protein